MKLLPLALAIPLTLAAADWPQWRGPEFNGSSPETNLPATFSPTNGVKWSAALPGPAAATPIIFSNHVFISSTDARTRTLLALAFDRVTGRELWHRDIGPGFARDDRSNFASCSPATDGRVVVFLYGNGQVAAFDFTGEPLWARNLESFYGPFAYLWTYSASPVLVDGQLIIQVLQRDVPVNGRGRAEDINLSFLLALDPATGKELWRHVRPSDAKAESREAFSTPVPATLNGRRQLLVAGGDCVSGHELRGGRELWRSGNWNPTRIGHWRLVASPLAAGNLVIVAPPKGAPIQAVRPGNDPDGALAWTSADREVSSDVSTPAFYQGRLYVLNSDRKTIARVDPATGKADWIGELDSRAKIEASPTVADGKIYFQNHAGEVFVVAAGQEFKVLHRAAFGDANDRDTRATLAVARGNLFLRTAGKLFCLGD